MNIFKKKSCAIGIISGADGPTSVFISGKQKAEEHRNQKDFLDFAATQVVANFRPFVEIEDFCLPNKNYMPSAVRKFWAG